MTRKFLWGVIILLLITNLTTLAIWMNERSPEQDEEFTVEVDKKEPVATINGTPIGYQEWTSLLENKYGKKVLKELIDHKVVSSLAEQEKININEKLIDREVSFLFTMQGVFTEEEQERQEKLWREEIEFRLLLEELLTKDIQVEENEIRNYFDQYSRDYEFDESVQLSHIRVDNQETAEKVISELESGASFAALAREYTVDEETRNDGGYLGYFTNGSDYIPADYFDRLNAMDEHSYSEPFSSGNEVAIVYLHRRLPSITFSYDEIKNQIRRDIALNELGQTIDAAPLWDRLKVDWIYD